MATITTDTYLDGGTARTAGEAWTMNGGTLTIRTDTRWHLNAPASMTGSLAAVTISSTLGGGYIADGRNVRWLAITGGSGTAAIGNTVSQGAVSGYFLGYWASLTSAPSLTIGATGFIKFREVTGGTFSAGALTFSGGGAATASGADVVGWIEVVHDQAITITVPRLGSFSTRGDWFACGTTTGSANQSVQIPTNGSTTTYVPGLYIETATADVYEFYPSIYAAGMSTTNLGTDARSKFVLMGTAGTCVIGHNGTTNVGYVPPAGRKIRVPNVFLRQCVTTTRNTNAIPHATATTRPDFTTTSAGYIDFENMMGDWYFLFAQPYYVKIKDSAVFDYVNISECATSFDLINGGNGISQSLDARTATITSCFAGGTITDWKSQRYAAGTTDHAFEVLYSIGLVFTRCYSGIVTFARSSGMSYQITQSANITMNDCYSLNSGLQLTTSFDCIINDHDHCDRYVGATTTTGINAVTITASCKNITVDGVTFGLKGTIANVHPYTNLFSIALSQDIKVRNIGTRSAFVNGGSANSMAYIFASGGNNQRVKFQRVYIAPTRTGAISTLNSDKDMLYEHVYGDMTDTMTIANLESKVRNCGGTNAVAGQASVYGTHFTDYFVSDTLGRVLLALNEPTTNTLPYVTYVSGTPTFTSAGSLVLNDVGDEVIIEMPYFAIAHAGFTTTAAVVTGTNVTYSSGARWGNHDIYFQIDTGSGWNGSWQNFTAAVLNTFSVTPATGFKLKIRMVCATASTTNLLTYIRAETSTSLANQTTYLYPLETVAVNVIAKDAVTGANIQNVLVYLYAGAGGGIAEGTPIINKVLTNSSGVASNSSFELIGTSQPVVGRARKGSGTPLYKTSPIAGTITSDGLDVTIFMISDE